MKIRFSKLSLVTKMRVKFTVVMLLMMLCSIFIYFADSQISLINKAITIGLSRGTASTGGINADIVDLLKQIETLESERHWFWWGIPCSLLLGIWFSVSLPQMGVLIDSIKETIDVMGKETTEIAKVSLQQVDDATDQVSAIEKATASFLEISDSARQISGRAKELEDIAQDTLVHCEVGEKTVIETIGAMSNIKKQVRSIAEAMIELGENSQKIGKIVGIIDDISEQTNLLALNAAIEAAGAGEYGRRFSIVAVEVRRLAERTADATKQINSLIENIQDHTNRTILLTEDGSKAAGTGGERVNDVGDAIKELKSMVARTSQAVGHIHLSTTTQTEACEDMVATVGDVGMVAKRVVQGALVVQASLSDLNRNSELLLELVSEVSTSTYLTKQEVNGSGFTPNGLTKQDVASV
jgi:methyl-accepting chemotaxis protein